METLLDIYDLACPRCDNAETLHIAITCMSVVTSHGSVPFGDHDWDSGSVCVCPECRHVAMVADFSRRAKPASVPGTCYNHAYDIAFSIETSDPTGATTSAQQFRDAIAKRLASLSDDKLVEAVGLPFASFEVTEPDA